MAVSFRNTEFDGLRNGDMVKVHIPELASEGDLSLNARGRIIRTMPFASDDGNGREVVIDLRIDPELHGRLGRYVDVRRIAMIRELAGADESDAEDEVATQPSSVLRRPSAI